MRSFRFLGLEYLAGGSRSSLGPYVIALADQIPRLVYGRTRSAPAPSDPSECPTIEFASVTDSEDAWRRATTKLVDRARAQLGS
jgi:hypothetical protein